MAEERVVQPRAASAPLGPSAGPTGTRSPSRGLRGRGARPVAHQCAPGPGSGLLRDVMSAPAPDDARVLLHVPTSTYLRLDRAAGRIVDIVEAEGEPEAAARVLADRYGIPVDRARADVGRVVGAVEGLRSAPGARGARGRRPTVGGAAAVVRGWWTLPVPRRWATAKAAAVVAVAEAGLHTVDLDRLSRLLRVPLSTGGTPPPDDGPDDLDRLSEDERRAYWAVRWVLHRWTHDATCLRQTLALGFFLRRRRPVLHLGLIEHGTLAHAWLEVEGSVYNALPVVGTFSAAGPGAAPEARPAP